MSHLFGVITNFSSFPLALEKGTEKDNKELDIALYYGSKDRCVRTINISLTCDKDKNVYDLYINGKLFKSFE